MVLAKHLTESDIKSLINLIDGWNEDKITWHKICDHCTNILGWRPTRQTLYNNQRIKKAYDSKKKSLKYYGPKKSLPSNLKTAAERIKRLENKVERLTEQNNQLLEKFVVWQYNAYKYGINEHQLNEPLPRIDRERSDDQ